MKATFENTVDILVKAYFKGTLAHGKCQACAVGNIMQSVGFPTIEDDDCGFADRDKIQKSCAVWRYAFITFEEDTEQTIRPAGDDFDIAVEAIEKTGYTWQQLAKVEFAFEKASKEGDRMFNGLMAVVDVLAEIHNVDLTVKESAKLLFIKSHV